jgi:hypothetical protein
MPVDNDEKAFDMALQVADYSARLMLTLRTFVDVSKRATSSGITFSGRDYSGTQLKYTDGDHIQTAVTNAEALLTYMETNFIDNVFDAVSKG